MTGVTEGGLRAAGLTARRRRQMVLNRDGANAMTDEIAETEASKPTLVLAPGAFTGETSLKALAGRLAERGYPVLIAPYVLEGVEADTAVLLGLLAQIQGPMVLVGHSYGGMLISNAACATFDVQALVFVAALAPDKGETMDLLLGDYPDAAPGEVTIAGAAGDPAWKLLPSWFVYGDADESFPPALHAASAARAGAVATVVVPGGSHDLMADFPDEVIGAIEMAVQATIAQTPNIAAD